MTRVIWLLRGLILVAMVAAILMAVHYRREGEQYRQECEQLKARPVSVTVAAAPVSGETGRTGVVYAPAPAEGQTEIETLQGRIVALENQLAEKEALMASWRQGPTNRPPDAFRRGGADMPFMGERGTNEVARRAEFEKRREEFQQKVQTAFARKAAFLLDHDTSKLKEDEKQQYEQMVSLLDETWELAAQMQGDLPGEQRREVMRALRDNLRTLDPLLISQRNREFHALAVSLGYSEPEAAQFTSYLTNIIEVTAASTLFPQFQGRGGGGGGGGGLPPGGDANRTRPTPGVQPPLPR